MKDQFTESVHQAAEKAVLKMISEGGWVQPDYQNRFTLPKGAMDEVWKLVDFDKLKAALAHRLEEELADRIVNHMASELATDIKQVLSVPERREAIRSVVRENIERLTKS